MPYIFDVQTVIETEAFIRSARLCGMTDREREAAISLIAAYPAAGDLIVGSGGCRKVRIAGRGKGKSGGYRVVTFYADAETPVFLLAVLSKGSDANFSDVQVQAMAQAAKRLMESLRRYAGRW
jgi:hypothetical protein